MVSIEIVIVVLVIIGLVTVIHHSINLIEHTLNQIGILSNKSTKFDLTTTIGWLQWEIYAIREREKEMALNLEALASEVTRVKTVHESAIKLIVSLSTELKEVSEKLKAQEADTAALDELVAKLDASTDALAAAVSVSHDNPVAESAWNTDHAMTPATGGAPSEGMDGTQSGKS